MGITQIRGSASSSTFITGSSSDTFYGGSGNDTVAFSGNRNTYTVTEKLDGSITVTNGMITDRGQDGIDGRGRDLVERYLRHCCRGADSSVDRKPPAWNERRSGWERDASCAR
jgi:hypothetical protein